MFILYSLSLIHILDIPAITGVDEDGNEVERHSSDDEPFSALVFKIMTDPFVGKLAYFRVYSGTMNSGSYVPVSYTHLDVYKRQGFGSRSFAETDSDRSSLRFFDRKSFCFYFESD